LKIEYVKTGIGNNFGEVIELNENLKKYPDLHDSILKHELKHTDKGFTWYDLKHDITESNVDSLDLLKFMIKHPRSFSQLLPIYFSKKHGFVYDINLIIIYVSLFIIYGLLTYAFISIV
jgi:hypothetical protein